MSPRELADGALRLLLAELGPELSTVDDLAARVIGAAMPEADATTRARAAAFLALELHRYYTAFEAILERIARQFDRRMPTGADRHRALLSQATLLIDALRPPIVSAASALELGRLLGFRHFLRHAYAVELDPARLEDHRLRVERLHPSLRRELLAFKVHLVAMLGTTTPEHDA